MREILFRGKRTDNDEWIKGYLHKTDGVGKGYRAFAIQVQDIDSYMCRPHSHEVQPKTVGQFTGLTDKNGKKIFEGDIIKSKSGNTYLIHFNDGSFAFANKDRIVVNYSLDDSEFGIAYKGICDGHEVIGNVFDNPELLEKDNA